MMMFKGKILFKSGVRGFFQLGEVFDMALGFWSCVVFLCPARFFCVPLVFFVSRWVFEDLRT